MQAVSPFASRKSLANYSTSPIAAGIALLAKDTGRVLMLQRALEDGDENGGKWEFPGGHIDDDTPRYGAIREFCEEVGLKKFPRCQPMSEWRSKNGKYQGFVYLIGKEEDVPLEKRNLKLNPDGDEFEAVAWVHPADFEKHNLRPELLDDIPSVRMALQESKSISPFLGRKSLAAHRLPIKSSGTCGVGQNPKRDGCTASTGESGNGSAPSASVSSVDAAVRAELGDTTFRHASKVAYRMAKIMSYTSPISSAIVTPIMEEAEFGTLAKAGGLVVATVGDWLVPGIPAGTGLVLLAATIRNPKSGWRGLKRIYGQAKESVSKIMARLNGGKALTEADMAQVALQVAQMIESADDQELALAVLCAALELTQGDVLRTVEIASEVLEDGAAEKALRAYSKDMRLCSGRSKSLAYLAKGDSYFSRCERDEEGRCEPENGGEKPKADSEQAELSESDKEYLAWEKREEERGNRKEELEGLGNYADAPDWTPEGKLKISAEQQLSSIYSDSDTHPDDLKEAVDNLLKSSASYYDAIVSGMKEHKLDPKAAKKAELLVKKIMDKLPAKLEKLAELHGRMLQAEQNLIHISGQEPSENLPVPEDRMPLEPEGDDDEAMEEYEDRLQEIEEQWEKEQEKAHEEWNREYEKASEQVSKYEDAISNMYGNLEDWLGGEGGGLGSIVLEAVEQAQWAIEDEEEEDPEPTDDEGEKSLPYSRFAGRKSLAHLAKDQSGSYFARCERDDEGHCKPEGAGGDAPKTEKKPGKTEQERKFKKNVARRGQMVSARREGEGKDARLVLADGSPAPEHVPVNKIPASWKDVEISLDPDADLLATGWFEKPDLKTGGTKRVLKKWYAPKFLDRGADLKFSRVMEMVEKDEQIRQEYLQARDTQPEEAEAVWLMDLQATRPGSESDTKGVSHLLGKKVSAENIEGEIKTDKKGKKSSNVFLVFDHEGQQQRVKVKDVGTAEQLLSRRDSGQDLADSDYWLNSYGATTLEARHVIESEDGVRLQFVGKEGVWHDHLIQDKGLANKLLERKQTAGERGGKLFATNEIKVRDFVKKLDGTGFTSKDLRTKRANLIALSEIQKMAECCKDVKEYKQAVKSVAEKVSHVLGNDPEMALAKYINPTVFSSWQAKCENC